MNQFALRVETLSKRYRIGAPPRSANGSQAVLDRLAAPFRYLASTFRPPAADETLWALRDVSFEVRPGEVIGIIGRNGAGKSTLLKILSRITEPSSGRAILSGRVGSLLEVGTGFHPELTGRENIYLSGAILGMRRAEIARKFDEIVAFAETEKFLDTPVKRYSSGMYVRLAFAVAAHLEPEILLVDEVLAVGDAAFQQKCLGQMGSVATQGRTVVFVSHNLVAVQGLCQRVIWLNQGQLAGCGETAEVIAKYLAAVRRSYTEQIWDEPETAPGNEQVRIRRISIRPQSGVPTDSITMATPICVEVEYWNLAADAHAGIRLRFLTDQQVIAFSGASSELSLVKDSQPTPTGLYRSTCFVPGDLLNEGMHSVLLLVIHNGARAVFRMDEALKFEVLNTGSRPGFRYSRELGAVRPLLDWTTERIGAL
jgi:lipopolysaccharide transport system ATP-binding protein